MEEKWYPGHIAKAKRRIKEKVKAVNSVIEMIDSRIPYSGRAYEWKKMFHNKHSIILLTKADLSDDLETKKWAEYYRRQGSICITLSLKEDPNKVRKNLEKLYSKIPSKSEFKRAMITGIPNVGKSTLINKILKKKSMRTGNTPGVTVGLQWINVSENFLLLDTPGILYSNLYSDNVKYKLILTGSIKGDVDTVDSAVFYGIGILRDHYPQLLTDFITYDFSQEKLNLFELYGEIAKKRGFLLKGGEYDIARARDLTLKAFQDGTIGKFTLETTDLLNEMTE
ncbi:MAG TPA: ribosome biogenesis GTPase YlqF [Thermotogota bacterium]|nr:ribosome biogenesis GTPase YlqF [Thermotogota bacterium]HPJ88906.1 ribosome biogenesis GTPase YlqF [Thermotogota bacterium]